MRMEREFLQLIGYDVSVQDPIDLVHWAHSFVDAPLTDDDYTSADEGGDELDDSDDDDDVEEEDLIRVILVVHQKRAQPKYPSHPKHNN
ncbi:hypothetical protein DFQ29_009544 [Apophysomyces sp. BC1021]|nr:hypothetical protein DFQ29_009544 [Apophysomyces sp. BC1021]